MANVLARDALIYTPQQLGTSNEQVVAGTGDTVDLAFAIKDLGGRGYVSALVEGGATLAAELIRGGHVDRIVLYLAAKLGLGRGLGAFAGRFATIAEAVDVEIREVSRVGPDLRVEVEVSS